MDNDAILVERCLTGDQAAWADLVRTHTRRIYNLCYRFTGRSAEAEDLTQDVFLRIYKTLGSFQGSQGSFTTWLTSVTRNLLIDHYRKHKREKLVDSLDDQVETVELSQAAQETTGRRIQKPDDQLLEKESSRVLQAAMDRLTPDLPEAVILRDLQELEYREISHILSVPEGTVKSRINRGRAALGRLLKRAAAAGGGGD